MGTIKLTEISVYPIKSTKGTSLDFSSVENLGIPFDRHFAVIDSDNKIITARENPRLLTIESKIENDILKLSKEGNESVQLNINEVLSQNSISVGIFKDFTAAIPIQHQINEWISNEIEQPVRLVKIDTNAPRKMKPKYNAKDNDTIPFCDAAPLHLISEASLNDLNSRFEIPFKAKRFRPNLVVVGCKPYEEETWKKISIGNCIFDIAIKTARCNFITINPETTESHERQEPLRTLSTYNRENAQTNFGIYLIPRKLGEIKIGDSVNIL